MAQSHTSTSVNGSWVRAQRQSGAANSHRAHVIEVARNELELLLQQRSIINKKVKQVKRVVEGLAILLGESFIGDQQPQCRCGDHVASPGSTGKIFSATDPRSVEIAQARVEKALSAAKLAPFNHVSKNKTLNSKLERACRIALLESEESATATQIYDRIIRRRSYRMNRYKYPLVQVIATLCILAERGEIEIQVKGEVRHWRWNRGVEEVENEFAATGFHYTTA